MTHYRLPQCVKWLRFKIINIIEKYVSQSSLLGKWRNSNLWPRYDLHVVGHCVVRCEVNSWRFVTLFRWNWIGLRKSLLLAPDQRSAYNVYISLLYIMAARTAGIDRNKKVTSQSSLSTYVLYYQCLSLASLRLGDWH